MNEVRQDFSDHRWHIRSWLGRWKKKGKREKKEDPLSRIEGERFERGRAKARPYTDPTVPTAPAAESEYGRH